MKSPRSFALVGFGVLAVASATVLLFRGPHAAVPQLASPVSPKDSPRPALTPAPGVGEIPASGSARLASGTSAKRPPREFSDELARALAESEPERRDDLISTALYHWAHDDLDAATAWTETQSVFPRAKAIAALVNGAAAASAEAAIHLVERLSATDSENIAEYGSDLIIALSKTGNAATAARWAEENKELNIDWLTGAFEHWAAAESETAFLHAIAINNPTRRRAAVDAAISGWSKTEPKSLAEYAANFPAGPEKNLAVVTALRAWAETDPKATADWMLSHRTTIASVPDLKTVSED